MFTKEIIFILFMCQLQAFGQIVQSCLPDGIIFNTQAQIDSFPINYLGCSKIEGFASFFGDDISNLDSLYSLTHIGGDLKLGHRRQFFYSCPLLNNINGLCNLSTIGGTLEVAGENMLENLSGLSSLTNIGGSIVIHGQNISSLVGLENIDTIHENLILYTDYHNSSIENLHALDGLRFIGGSFIVGGLITNFSGLDSLTCIGGAFLTNNVHPYLENFHGLENLDSIGGCCYIHGTLGAVQNLNGLNNLKSIGGMLSIAHSVGLTSLYGLENLQSIGGGLQIHCHILLPNLVGLENLTSIGGRLFIQANASLESLKGLDNIDPNTITELYIGFNDTLTDCAIKSVCDYISSPNNNTNILYNSNGCWSKEQVEVACETVTIEDRDLLTNCSISPNPFTTSTTLSYTLGKPENVQFTVYNVQGQIVFMMKEKQETGKQKVQWNADELPAGMYFYRLVAGERNGSGKLVVGD